MRSMGLQQFFSTIFVLSFGTQKLLITSIEGMYSYEDITPHNQHSDSLFFVSFLFSGHANCEDFKEPASPDPNVPLPEWFHWDRFPNQNTVAKRIVEDSGAIFMDVSTITRNRPDGHPYMNRDCLHYCLPGPIDTWVQLLFNIFNLILKDA